MELKFANRFSDMCVELLVFYNALSYPAPADIAVSGLLC